MSSQPAAAAAAAPAAAAGSDGPTEAEKAEGIAEVGWRLPAQWSDGTWRASARRMNFVLALSRPFVLMAARFTSLVCAGGTDEAEVLHRQRNPVTQTFEYYVHYVECAPPARLHSFGSKSNSRTQCLMFDC